MPVRIGDLGNVGANAVVAVRDQGLVLGSVEYVLLEALVSKIFRAIARAPKRPFVEDIILHSLTVPFVGGLGIYGPAPHRGPFVHVDTRGEPVRW